MNIYTHRLKQYFIRNKWFLLAFVVLGVFFKMYPQIDIVAASQFYNETERFFLANHPLSMFVYHGVHYLTGIMATVFILSLIYMFVTKKAIFGIGKKTVAFMLAALILAPGLVTNTILKDNVGRPRPDAVIEFGGPHTFVPPFTISNACDKNCSFVSGHASLGFYLMVFGLVATGARRKYLLSAGFLAGVVIGFVRIIQGRHFFTDVVFAFFFVYFTMSLLHALMYGFDDEQ